jgi:hypothetical protein
MGWAYGTQGEEWKAYRSLLGKTEGTKPLGRTKEWREGNIEMDFREIGWAGMDWIHMAQYRDQWSAPMNTVMNLRIT